MYKGCRKQRYLIYNILLGLEMQGRLLKENSKITFCTISREKAKLNGDRKYSRQKEQSAKFWGKESKVYVNTREQFTRDGWKKLSQDSFFVPIWIHARKALVGNSGEKQNRTPLPFRIKLSLENFNQWCQTLIIQYNTVSSYLKHAKELGKNNEKYSSFWTEIAKILDMISRRWITVQKRHICCICSGLVYPVPLLPSGGLTFILGHLT